MEPTTEYRVVEMKVQDFVDYGILHYIMHDPNQTILAMVVAYIDDNGKVVGSTNPFEGFGVGAVDVDSLRTELHQVQQALERPFLRLADLPGSSDYVDPDAPPPVATALPYPAEGFDDGSGPDPAEDPMVPADVDAGLASVDVERDADVAEPDPDVAHDDPGEVADEAEADLEASLSDDLEVFLNGQRVTDGTAEAFMDSGYDRDDPDDTATEPIDD